MRDGCFPLMQTVEHILLPVVGVCDGGLGVGGIISVDAIQNAFDLGAESGEFKEVDCAGHVCYCCTGLLSRDRLIWL